MNKKFIFTVLKSITVLSCIFADPVIINPAPGTWANRQTLVLSTTEDNEELFYSINGSDPDASGFAYDGPVLIDVDGDVVIRVTAIEADGSKKETEQHYTVSSASLPTETSAAEFIQKAVSLPLTEYTAGTELTIPSNLQYSFGQPPESWLPGAKLSCSAENAITRFLPCTVTDGNAKWRFIIKTLPSQNGAFSKRDLPFRITDWNTIDFTDAKMIYRIDDQDWMQPKESVKIDRSSVHTISWQSIAFEKGNPVQMFTIPVRPELKSETLENGAVRLSVSGEGFSIGLTDGSSSSVLFPYVEADTFPGDELCGEFTASVYYQSVYQGQIPFDFNIDRRAPSAPVITPDTDVFYSRKDVNIKITTERNSELFVFVSEPKILNPDDENEKAALSASVPEGEFVKSEDGKIKLLTDSEQAVFYKVCAYAVDAAGNKSVHSEYCVILDSANFYLDAASADESADGSKTHPYVSFGQCLDTINKGRFARIRAKGIIKMPEGETSLLSNCMLLGTGETRILLSPSSCISVKSASFEISGCIIEKGAPVPGSGYAGYVIKLAHSVLTMNNCELACVFGKNGTAINADDSVINITAGSIAVSADNYAVSISADNSKTTIKDCLIASSADTAVNFSVHGGTFELRGTQCKAGGRMGRNGELFCAKTRMTGNTFTSEFQKTASAAVYSDDKTVFLENKDNDLRGY